MSVQVKFRRLGWGAVSGLVVIGMLQATPAEAAVGVPGSLTPTGTVSSNAPVLSWSKVSGAARYEVQVDNTDDFSSPAFTSSTTNNRAVPTSLLGRGEQFFRVRAVNSSSVASGWAVSGFTISAFAAPTPLSPVGGQVLAQPQDPPLLTWEGTQGATEYRVQVDAEGNDDSWVGAKEYVTKSTSIVVPDPLAVDDPAQPKTYFWRVQATKASGIFSDYSAQAEFAVGSLNQPAIVSPDDSPDNEVEDVVLDWNPVPGAQYYQLRVATDQDFNNVVDNQIKVLGTRYSPPITYKNNQYFWQVRAVDLSGNPTSWSDLNANFSRVWPDTPRPVFPADPALETITDPVYFQWTPVQHATQYELQVGSDPSFSPDTFNTCMIAGTTYTPFAFPLDEINGSKMMRPDEDCNPTPGGISYWRVRPLDRPQPALPAWVLGNYSSDFSEPESFKYDPQDVSSFSPINGATVDVPTLRWSPIRDADYYEITIKDKFGSTIKSNVKTYSTSYTVVGRDALDPAKGPFTWFLSARAANGLPASVTYQNQFNVSGSIPTSGAAPLAPLSGRPADGPTLRAPALTWEPYPGADSYQLFVGPADSGTVYSPVFQDALGKKLPYPAVTDTWTWFLRPGGYDWFVQAYDDAGALLERGPTTRFTIAQLAAVQGQRIAIDGASLDADAACTARIGGTPDICPEVPSTPVFDWDPVEGAALYVLYLSEDANFTNLVEPATSLPATSNTRWAPTLSSLRAALPDSQAGGAYYWHVRPCKSAKSCRPTPISTSNSATNKFRKRSPAVVQTLPASGASVTSTDVTFDWDDYFATNQAATWSATGEHSPQAAMQYHLQVSRTGTFSNTPSQNLDDVLVDQSTYTAFTKLYPEGTLYWRVQATDAEGNGLAWSDVSTFVKRSPTVQLTSPVGGSQGAGTRPFRWQAQAFAGSYEIQVAANGDTQFSSPLFTKTVKQTAYAWDVPVPASSQPYVWRVRRIDADSKKNPGPWSPAASFYSRGAVPALLSPTSGTQQPNNGPLFTWSEVTGATSYDLEVRTSSSSTNWVKVTTAASSWATVKTVPDGSWQWRVTAKDANKNVLGVSGWGTFLVDFGRPFVKAWTPTGTARRTKNFTATFSEAVRGVSGTTVRLYLGRTKVRAKVTYSSSLRRATLNPNAYLKRGRTYTMKVSGAIRDAKGNAVVAKKWKVTIR